MGEYRELNPPEMEVKECPHCSAEFEEGIGHGDYCSKACYKYDVE